MEIKDIDSYFEFRILRRGYDYYKNNHITSIKTRDGIIEAVVKGTRIYDVEINLNTPCYELKCSCPYEDNCKHEAAVLYYLKSGKKIKEGEKEVITFTNESELKKCLNSELRKLRISSHYSELTEGDLNEILIKYSKLINDEKDSLDKYNYFLLLLNWLKENRYYFSRVYYEEYEDDDYDEVYDCDYEDEESLEDDVVYRKNIDLYGSIFKYFGLLLEDMKYLKFYCNYLYKQVDTDDFDSEEVEKLTSAIKNQAMANEVILLLEKLIKKEDYLSYKYQPLILEIKMKFYNVEDVLREAKENLDNEYICEFLLKYYKDKDCNEYEEILEKIFELNGRETSHHYIDELVHIYKENEELDKLYKLLKFNFDYNPSYTNYMNLKEYYDAKTWMKVKSLYIEYVKEHRSYDCVEIFLEEEMYDEVFDRLSRKNIMVVDSYMDKLLHYDRQRTLNLLRNRIEEEMFRASTRDHYLNTITYLIKFIKYGADKQIVKNMIDTFKTKYSNRKAMKEELEFFEDTYL